MLIFLQLNPGLSISQKCSWGLQTAFTTTALWISLVYWSVLHAYVVKWGLMDGAWMQVTTLSQLHCCRPFCPSSVLSLGARPY